MPDEPIKPGRELAGRYVLEERLGEGGMGAIWRARHLVLDAPVAVKILSRDVAESEETVARFLREAKAAASLRSVHVVQILDYGVEEEIPFIAMELLEGETLRQRIKRKGTLTAEETARIVADVCRAIGRAHDAGIVHRDLKPENIFLVPEDDAEIAKVLDFGVAKVSASTLGPEATKTRTGSLLGTPYYMSPEQAQGNKEVDHRSDLWSLGVIAFECITGKRPFTSDALGDLVLAICVRDIAVPSEHATVPAGFDEWFARAVQREPQARFQSAREMIEALRDCLGDEYRLTIGTTPDDGEGTTSPKPPESEPEPTILPRQKPASADDDADLAIDVELESPGEGQAALAGADGRVLDDTLLATPQEVEARARPLAEQRRPRRMVYLVGAGALLLGLAGGVWVLRTYYPSERGMPDALYASGADDRADRGAVVRSDRDDGGLEWEEWAGHGIGSGGLETSGQDLGQQTGTGEDAGLGEATADAGDAGPEQADAQAADAAGDAREAAEAGEAPAEPSAQPPPEPSPEPSDPEAAEAYPSPTTGPY